MHEYDWVRTNVCNGLKHACFRQTYMVMVGRLFQNSNVTETVGIWDALQVGTMHD